jgi:hypothetical protein
MAAGQTGYQKSDGIENKFKLNQIFSSGNKGVYIETNGSSIVCMSIACVIPTNDSKISDYPSGYIR